MSREMMSVTVRVWTDIDGYVDNEDDRVQTFDMSSSDEVDTEQIAQWAVLYMVRDMTGRGTPISEGGRGEAPVVTNGR